MTNTFTRTLSRKFFSFLAIILVSTGLLISAPSVALADVIEIGDLVFYSGNECTGDIVFTYNSEVSANDNCQTSGTSCYSENDKAKSLLITGFAKPATRVKVYDDPANDTANDYAVIDILPDLPPQGSCVSTFEQSGIKPGFRMSYLKKDGLDGNISHVTLQP